MAELEEKQKVSQNKGNNVVKHTVKDSVFTNLFKEKKYLVQLYKALHPENADVTEEDIKEVTVSNVLVDDIYNDVGFMVRSTLLVLVECQSTWTANIIFRALMYLVQTYREYFKRQNRTCIKVKSSRCLNRRFMSSILAAGRQDRKKFHYQKNFLVGKTSVLMSK